MTDRTKIEWTDATWNALRGCSKVSAGCTNCYAVGMAARFSGHGLWGHGIAERTCGGPRWTGAVVLDEKALTTPLHWKKPRRIFVTSIGDPFHPAVTDDMLDRTFAVMALAPQHTFQLLTKRPERMREYIGLPSMPGGICEIIHVMQGRTSRQTVRDDWTWPLPNLWIGARVENQATADTRIQHLLDTPAAVRFLSCEPLLGPVDLTRWTAELCPNCLRPDCVPTLRADSAEVFSRCGAFVMETPRSLIDWVIVGGESGPKARPMHPDWARSLRDQCAAARVPFFMKQMGGAKKPFADIPAELNIKEWPNA